MANVSVDIRADRFAEVIARFPGAVDTILSAGVERAVAYAQANHPWQNQTGVTEASIHSEKVGAHQFALVAGGAMQFLEFGTVHMRPFPTIRPAMDATKDSIVGGFSKLESYL